MSKQKLLTICLPTYNRAKYLKMQLERFSSMPQELWQDIRIFISDNCSTDNTQSIGNEYSGKEGVDIVYHRNESNLGMDGNFVTCFKAAKTRYVWLLGDDDTIIIERLPLVVNMLKGPNLGVLHLGINRNAKKDYYKDEDAEHFIKEIGIWITYISSNIVNTKYVDEVEFDKYYGTFFTLMPVYLKAILGEQINCMFNLRIFEDGKDVKRNGGYNYIQVFVNNYLSIFKEFVDNGEISEVLYMYEEEVSFNFVMPYLLDYVVLGRESNYIKTGSWSIMFRQYGLYKTCWGFIVYILKRVLSKVKNTFGFSKK